MIRKPKAIIIDYRNRSLDVAPPGTYIVSIILFLYNGHPLLEVVDGEYKGKIFIGSKMFGFDDPQTLH